MNTKPSYQILAEYGLTEYMFDALKACEDPTYWKTGDLTHSIASLYNLRDRGLLTGPPTGKPHSVPFHLTPDGRNLLARIERGLHKPEWLSEHQARLLDILADGIEIDYAHLIRQKIRPATLNSLNKAGYIMTSYDPLFNNYKITDLGREAWLEAQTK